MGNNPSGSQFLRLLGEYKRLDKKQGQLTEAEKKRFDELSRKLESFLDKKAEGKQPKRDFVRVACAREIVVQSKAALRKLYIENISGGGLYMASSELLPIGTKIDFEILVEEPQRRQKFVGSVAWVNPKGIQGLAPGMGIKFENLTPEQNQFLKELIHIQLDREIGKPDS